MGRSSTKRNSLKPEDAGVTFGKPSKALYKQARADVLARREFLKEEYGDSEFEVPKTNPKFHYLHGKKYDLRKFWSKHPGGKDILKMTAGLIDSTPTFESYHAFANMPSIMKQLEKYEVTDEEDDGLPVPQPIYSFDDDGFYKTLKRRVRVHYGGREDGKDSLTKETKANRLWAIKVGIQAAFFVLFFSLAFFKRNLPTPVAMIFAVLAGSFMIQWGFTVMHDGSHFAIAPKNHPINITLTRIWCAIALWNAKTWMYHHAVMHHSYTGAEELDPDISHALPFVAKSADTKESKYLALHRIIGDKFGKAGWAASAISLYVFLPGMWMGQVLQYAMYNLGVEPWKNLWGMKPRKEVKGYETQIWEIAISLAVIGAVIARGSFLIAYTYFVALNFFYSMCIVADHDLVESAITNHLDVDVRHLEQQPECEPGSEAEKKKADWGEIQVRNSTDFVNDKFNIFAHMHGSINFQIEHHLFPGMSHIHLPEVSKITKQTCHEFGIPYTTYPNLADAWSSFLLVVRAVMTGKDVREDF